jgi:hypothetical protein
MIGGTVIETIVLPDKVWINCKENQSSSTCAIYVASTAKARSVSEGDTIWWQSSLAYWTPKFHKSGSGKPHKDYDIKLDRVGFSGAKRPETEGAK